MNTYSDFNGENFNECVNEIIEMHGEREVLYRMLKVLDDIVDEDLKFEILNDLWCM